MTAILFMLALIVVGSFLALLVPLKFVVFLVIALISAGAKILRKL